MVQRTAIIAGATGLVGALCLKQLLDDPAYAQVTAILRRPSGRSHPKLTEKIVDFDKLSSLSPIAADDAFCALGTTNSKAGSQETYRKIDFGYSKAFAEFALAGDAKQFALVSSVGANARSRTFYLRTKGEIEDAVVALPFQSVHIFQPSFLIGERQELRTGEGPCLAIAKMLQFAFVGSFSKHTRIAHKAIAAAVRLVFIRVGRTAAIIHALSYYVK